MSFDPNIVGGEGSDLGDPLNFEEFTGTGIDPTSTVTGGDTGSGTLGIIGLNYGYDPIGPDCLNGSGPLQDGQSYCPDPFAGAGADGSGVVAPLAGNSGNLGWLSSLGTLLGSFGRAFTGGANTAICPSGYVRNAQGICVNSVTGKAYGSNTGVLGIAGLTAPMLLIGVAVLILVMRKNR